MDTELSFESQEPFTVSGQSSAVPVSGTAEVFAFGPELAYESALSRRVIRSLLQTVKSAASNAPRSEASGASATAQRKVRGVLLFQAAPSASPLLPSWRQRLSRTLQARFSWRPARSRRTCFDVRGWGWRRLTRARGVQASPAVSRLLAVPQRIEACSHGNLPRRRAHCGRPGVGMRVQGEKQPHCRRDRQVLRTFGRSLDPANEAHRLEACGKNVVLVFHAASVTGNPEKSRPAIVKVRRIPRA